MVEGRGIIQTGSGRSTHSDGRLAEPRESLAGRFRVL